MPASWLALILLLQQTPSTTPSATAPGTPPQTANTQGPPRTPPSGQRPPTHEDLLRGDYSRWRANNDLLSYHLDIRVDPDKKSIAGKNTIRFKMLKDDTRIQLDLFANLNIDKIQLENVTLKYSRDVHTVYVDFPSTLKAGRTYTIDFYYSGTPSSQGRFDGFSFRKDAEGHTWITTACEGVGARLWWPNKDQW